MYRSIDLTEIFGARNFGVKFIQVIENFQLTYSTDLDDFVDRFRLLLTFFLEQMFDVLFFKPISLIKPNSVIVVQIERFNGEKSIN